MSSSNGKSSLKSENLVYAILSAATYDPVVQGVQRITYEDISADIVDRHILAIRGTDSFETLKRDFLIEPKATVEHPEIGKCQAGALQAALGLLNLIPSEIDILTGHSEGGTIAEIIAGIITKTKPIKTLVTWDSPKGGEDSLAYVLRNSQVDQYRFSGSLVTDWPVLIDRQIRSLITIGEWTIDPLEAHSINRAVTWLKNQ